jgi:hypothetical protein
MFVREKSARGHIYLYLVENEREGGRIRQRIIRALGRKDVLLASGELDRLAALLMRHCDRAVILSDMEAGRIACTRIGGPLLFGRLWERLGIAEVLGERLASRGFEFAVERAVFASFLHRLRVGLRSQLREMDDRLPDRGDRRAAAAPPLPGNGVARRGDRPRRRRRAGAALRQVKDLLEERLFERRRDLFSDLSLVFLDTTSLSFYGAGSDSLGETRGEERYASRAGKASRFGAAVPPTARFDRLLPAPGAICACPYRSKGAISALRLPEIWRKSVYSPQQVPSTVPKSFASDQHQETPTHN